MISFVSEKFTQNMVRIVKNVREEVVVHVNSRFMAKAATVKRATEKKQGKKR